MSVVGVFRMPCVVAVFFLCLFTSSQALASMSAPRIFPAEPMAGQSVSLQLQGQGCDAVVQEPGYPRFRFDGSTIRLLVQTIHAVDPAACIYDPPARATFDLGSYPAGTYTLQVERHYDMRMGLAVVQSIGSQTFTARASTPPWQAPEVTVPALGLMCCGLWGLRGRPWRAAARSPGEDDLVTTGHRDANARSTGLSGPVAWQWAPEVRRFPCEAESGAPPGLVSQSQNEYAAPR